MEKIPGVPPSISEVLRIQIRASWDARQGLVEKKRRSILNPPKFRATSATNRSSSLARFACVLAYSIAETGLELHLRGRRFQR